MASVLIEKHMYGGRYFTVHNPNARGSQPRYKVTDTLTDALSKPKGITTILGKVLGKDLMGWAVKCMGEYLEAKLPVVTKEDLDEAAKEYERRRDSGAGTGTEAHALVEQFLKGEVIDLSGSSKEAKAAFGAFKTWYEGSKPEVINVEEVIYSPSFGFCGTYDCMLRIDGKVWLCDLKTTNASRSAPRGVYADYFIQLGAYAMAHEEERQFELTHTQESLKPEIQGLLVISCKKNGKLDLISNEDIGLALPDCMDMAKKTVNIFHFLEYTRKALGGR